MTTFGRNIESLADFFAVTDRDDDPLYEVTLWPYRSLSDKGFVTIILLICLGFLVPITAFFGSPFFWGILPFMAAAVWGLWAAIQKTNKDATVRESLKLWPDLVAVYRKNPRSEDQYWCAHPQFVKVHLREDTKIEHYITLSGGNREIELGAFLTPEERLSLFEALDRAIYQAKFPVS